MRKAIICIAIALTLAFGAAATAHAATVSDVPDSHWAKVAVDKLLGLGLIEGYPDGTFKGNQPMSRYEYAVIVARMVDSFDAKFCTREDCKQPPAQAAPQIDETKINEIRDLLNKLTEEFKYEIAAIKVKTDELEKRMNDIDAKTTTRLEDQDKRIAAVEERAAKPIVGIWTISGKLRQRIDSPDSELAPAELAAFYDTHYLGGNGGVSPTKLKTGYELLPTIAFTGNVKPNATINLQFSKYLTNKPYPSDVPTDSALAIDYANLALDLSNNVRELDNLGITIGYQPLILGPFGILLDNAGLMSNAAILVTAGKGAISVASAVGYGDITGHLDSAGNAIGGGQNLGAGGSDIILASRIGIDLSIAKLGFNILSNGFGNEKGWSADIEANLLKDKPFLKAIRGEYAVLTETWDSSAWPTMPDGEGRDYAYAVFVDAYQTKKMKITLGYADTPAVPAVSSLDANPFTETDTACAAGSDYPNNTGRPCFTSNYETGTMLFPGGFKGFGMEASTMVFGNITVTGRLVSGDYAGGGRPLVARGINSPGYGSLSLSKPINDSTSITLEYLQQGMDPILINRLRSEFLVNF